MQERATFSVTPKAESTVVPTMETTGSNTESGSLPTEPMVDANAIVLTKERKKIPEFELPLLSNKTKKTSEAYKSKSRQKSLKESTFQHGMELGKYLGVKDKSESKEKEPHKVIERLQTINVTECDEDLQLVLKSKKSDQKPKKPMPQITLEQYKGSAMYVDEEAIKWFSTIREASIRRLADDRGFVTVVGTIPDSRLPIWLPHAPFRRVWDVLTILLVIYNSITLPLLTGFADEINQPAGWIAFDYCVDFFFLIDILLNFRTAYENEHEMTIIVDPKSIKVRYLKGWFMIDFLSIVPIELLVLLIAAMFSMEGNLGGDSQVKMLALLKLPRLLRLGRLLKFLEGMAYANLFKIAKLFCGFVLAAHWVACLFGFILSLQTQDGWWIHKIEEGTVMLPNSLTHKYTAFFYASILLIIGENIEPRTNTERAFFSVMILFGASLYATIFGNVSLLIATMNMESTTYTNKVASVSRTMRALNLPDDVRERISLYHEYMFHRYRSADREEFLTDLSLPLRAEVLLYINVGLIKKVPLFEDSDPSFILEICRYLNPHIYQPGDYITRIGQPGDKLYFVSVGEIEVDSLDVNGNLVPQDIIYAGSYFGEQALIEEDYLLTYSCRALVYCDLNVMAREDLMSCLLNFPETKQRLIAKIYKDSEKRVQTHAGNVVGALRAFSAMGNTRDPTGGLLSEHTSKNRGRSLTVESRNDLPEYSENVPFDMTSLAPKEEEAYRTAFAAFDKDGDGTINASELGIMMKSLGFFPTEEQLVKMIADCDDDGSGQIEFEEFCQLMSKGGANVGAVGKSRPASPWLNPKTEPKQTPRGPNINKGMLTDISNLLVHISSQIETLARNQDTTLKRVVSVEQTLGYPMS